MRKCIWSFSWKKKKMFKLHWVQKISNIEKYSFESWKLWFKANNSIWRICRCVLLNYQNILFSELLQLELCSIATKNMIRRLIFTIVIANGRATQFIIIAKNFWPKSNPLFFPSDTCGCYKLSFGSTILENPGTREKTYV